MTRASMKVSGDTYEMVIKTRGILEHLFRRKLSLDETVYLSSRLISFIYETVQKLEAQNRIKIQELDTGEIRVEGIEGVPEIIPDVVEEFTEINRKLAEKDKENSRLTVRVKR